MDPLVVDSLVEAEMLKKEAEAMQDEINFINQRISELESAAKKT